MKTTGQKCKSLDWALDRMLEKALDPQGPLTTEERSRLALIQSACKLLSPAAKAHFFDEMTQAYDREDMEL